MTGMARFPARFTEHGRWRALTRLFIGLSRRGSRCAVVEFCLRRAFYASTRVRSCVSASCRGCTGALSAAPCQPLEGQSKAFPTHDTDYPLCERAHALHKMFAFGPSTKHLIQCQLERLEPTLI
jgi:hypothetical protein